MGELLRRAAPGVAIAGVALGSVWLFDPALHGNETVTPTAAESGTASSDSGSESGTGSGSDTGSGSSDSGSADPGSTDSGSSDSGSTDSGSTDSGSSGSAGSSDSGSSGSSADCGSGTTTETGDAVMTQWGPVQVQMRFAADGSVCDVQAVAYPANDPHSSRINAMAIPYLDQAATQQGVSFDAVSGATYTSEAYRESMQSILDRR